jgi:hypothetical protein
MKSHILKSTVKCSGQLLDAFSKASSHVLLLGLLLDTELHEIGESYLFENYRCVKL